MFRDSLGNVMGMPFVLGNNYQWTGSKLYLSREITNNIARSTEHGEILCIFQIEMKIIINSLKFIWLENELSKWKVMEWEKSIKMKWKYWFISIQVRIIKNIIFTSDIQSISIFVLLSFKCQNVKKRWATYMYECI